MFICLSFVFFVALAQAHTLPEVDQRWISKVLFWWTAQGHPELVFSRVNKRWCYPLLVPLKTSNSPSLDKDHMIRQVVG